MPNLEEIVIPFLLALGAGFLAYLLALAISPKLFHVISHTQKPLISRWIDFFAYGLILTFFVAFLLIDVRKIETLSVFGVDFAFFDQAIWNSLHGRLLQNTVYLDSPTILGHHFSPILLALVPLYAFHGDPRTLAIMPAVAISLSAIPLYWFARKQLGRLLALIVLFVFFLSPVVQYAALKQFYELVLAVPILSFAMLFLLRHRYAPFLICLALALLVKEEVAVAAIGIGIYIVFFQRKFWLGLVLTLFCLFYTLGLLLVVIPHFQGGSNYYFFGGTPGQGGNNLYGYLGSSLLEIVVGIFTRPSVVLQQMLTPPKVDAVLRLLFPVGLLPLAGAEVTFLAVPVLAYILLSDAPWVYTFGSWHYATILPFLFLGMVVGLRRVLDWFSKDLRRLWGLQRNNLQLTTRGILGAFVLIVSLANNYVNPDPGLLGNYSLASPSAVSAHMLGAQKIAQSIPEDAIVHTQSELAPYVSSRRFIYIEAAIPCYGIADYVFLDKTLPWYSYRENLWQTLLSRDDWQTLIDQDGYILKRRASPTVLVNAQFGGVLTLLGYTFNSNQAVRIQGGQTIAPIIIWRMERETQSKYVISAKLADSAGHVWATYVNEPGGGFCPTDTLRLEQTINDQISLQLPPTMPAGSYDLQIGVYDKSNGEYLAVRDSEGHWQANDLLVTKIEIGKNKSSFTATELRDHFQLDQPYYVDMGEMRFLGYVPPRQTIAPGELLQVGLYWRAREKPRGDYVVAVQLRDATGRVVFEQANRPANGTYPTAEWNAGEVLLDWHDFNLPNDIVPGEYQVFVVLRDSVNNRELGQTSVSSLTIIR